MPNGSRVPYRLSAIRPSPVHSSDSEDTDQNKRKYWKIVPCAISRWKAYTREKKSLRRTVALSGVATYLANAINAETSAHILSFLVVRKTG